MNRELFATQLPCLTNLLLWTPCIEAVVSFLLLTSIRSEQVLTTSLYGYLVLILSRLHVTYTHILINSFACLGKEADPFTHLSVMVSKS